jgi:hypothetical protein
MSAAFIELDPKKQREVRAKIKRNLQPYVNLALLRFDEMAARHDGGEQPDYYHGLWACGGAISSAYPEWQPHMVALVQQKKNPEPQAEWVETFFEVAWVTFVDMTYRASAYKKLRTEKLLEKHLWTRLYRILDADKTLTPLRTVTR